MNTNHGSADHEFGAAAIPAQSPTDPDVDLKVPAQRRELVTRPLTVLSVIALGGVLGAEARYGLGVAVPHAGGAWPWATFVENASGSLLIGVLMVVLTVMPRPHPLARPFLGVGVLGGYTTFSTYTVEALTLWQHGRTAVAIGYVVATPVVAVLACALGVVVTRPLARLRWADRVGLEERP